jgi:hypothetical protein
LFIPISDSPPSPPLQRTALQLRYHEERKLEK